MKTQKEIKALLEKHFEGNPTFMYLGFEKLIENKNKRLSGNSSLIISFFRKEGTLKLIKDLKENYKKHIYEWSSITNWVIDYLDSYDMYYAIEDIIEDVVKYDKIGYFAFVADKYLSRYGFSHPKFINPILNAAIYVAKANNFNTYHNWKNEVVNNLVWWFNQTSKSSKEVEKHREKIETLKELYKK